jgi:3-methyl-2-oxobutanoate hydroxymethyltransferase
MKDLRAARESGPAVAMLTCYDFTTAKLMASAGVNALLVGDSAASVILGHENTLPVSLDFMIEITAAVRRGAPKALVVADMPFGSYHQSSSQGVKNVARMVQLSGCDCVKLEASEKQARLISLLTDAGVPTMAHLGLRPQTVNLLGGYRVQGRTAGDAEKLIQTAIRLERAGAASLLLEAVPPPVAQAIVEATKIPIIGCGAGNACHGHVVVTQDALGMTGTSAKFVPQLADLGTAMKAAFADYVRQVESGEYPGPQHAYEMPENELEELSRNRPHFAAEKLI